MMLELTFFFFNKCKAETKVDGPLCISTREEKRKKAEVQNQVRTCSSSKCLDTPRIK